MPLQLHPDLENLTREEIENRILLIQSRRMSAAVVFFSGQNAKTKKQISIFERRVAQELERLKKEFEMLDRYIAKVEARARKVDMLRNQLSQSSDDLVLLDDPDSDDE